MHKLYNVKTRRSLFTQLLHFWCSLPGSLQWNPLGSHLCVCRGNPVTIQSWKERWPFGHNSLVLMMTWIHHPFVIRWNNWCIVENNGVLLWRLFIWLNDSGQSPELYSCTTKTSYSHVFTAKLILLFHTTDIFAAAFPSLYLLHYKF